LRRFSHTSHGLSSGMVTCTEVPPPRGLTRRMVPPNASTRSSRPISPESRRGSAPPTPSSTTETSTARSSARTDTSILEAFPCFAAALSTCLRCNGNSALGGSGAVEARGSGGFRRPGDVGPGGEAVGHLGAIVIGGEPMAAGPEMRGDHAEHRQEPLGCAGGAEAFHGAFALPGRLVRVLRPVQVG